MIPNMGIKKRQIKTPASPGVGIADVPFSKVRKRVLGVLFGNPMWNQTGFDEKVYETDELERFPKGAGFPGGKADWGWMQHILASLDDKGRAAVVLDTGAASRGSGNANSNKEKEVRKWFVEHDLIEGLIYLPENLFYNTTAPGIIIVLNKAKPKARKDKLLLINAAKEFKKGDPKNYITDEGIERIAEAFIGWREQDKFSRVVGKAEIVKNDYNISPSRYIHTGASEEYRPIAEIMEELEGLATARSKVLSFPFSRNFGLRMVSPISIFPSMSWMIMFMLAMAQVEAVYSWP